MSGITALKLGRINANEDEAKLIEIVAKDGGRFEKGEPLLTLETTKAAVEILAPSSGRMIEFKAKEGAILQLGDVVFEAEFDGEASFEILEPVVEIASAEAANLKSSNNRKVSFKAERLAKSLGLDVALIPSIGDTVKEQDVCDYAEKLGVGIESLGLTVRGVSTQATGAVIFGAGGHAKSIVQMIREAGYTVAGVIDTKLPKGSMFMGVYPVMGGNDDLKSIRGSGISVAFIGVGGATNNKIRERIFDQLKEVGFVLPPLVSKMAAFDLSSHLGEATYVFPAASVGAGCMIGNNVILNQGSVISHDCKIMDHVHLAPNSILAGTVTVCSRTTIGMAATIMNNVTIGENCLIHNTVAVACDVPSGKTCTLRGII